MTKSAILTLGESCKLHKMLVGATYPNVKSPNIRMLPDLRRLEDLAVYESQSLRGWWIPVYWEISVLFFGLLSKLLLDFTSECLPAYVSVHHMYAWFLKSEKAQALLEQELESRMAPTENKSSYHCTIIHLALTFVSVHPTASQDCRSSLSGTRWWQLRTLQVI